ncbi:hypothetical protein NDU88_000911 [Pleurodeles waltl]|uniref:Uncharacterized protein n=1 Tax=Pleurodeles waltl TaxID=8319 RepID=A0AAV7MND7_PLEWA|nr:hypothetical protein NDU88_000911 [Pleurodeles waltl]
MWHHQTPDDLQACIIRQQKIYMSVSSSDTGSTGQWHHQIPDDLHACIIRQQKMYTFVVSSDTRTSTRLYHQTPDLHICGITRHQTIYMSVSSDTRRSTRLWHHQIPAGLHVLLWSVRVSVKNRGRLEQFSLCKRVQRIGLEGAEHSVVLRVASARILLARSPVRLK